ncbi:MAG: M1 family aminopeptidase [Planctomycetota bacterium]
MRRLVCLSLLGAVSALAAAQWLKPEALALVERAAAARDGEWHPADGVTPELAALLADQPQPAGDIGLLLAGADDTDVLHYDYEVEIFPTTRAIAGQTTMTIRSLADNLTTFRFRLHDVLTITALRVGGVNTSYQRLDAATLEATLDRPYARGEVFNLHVEYNGTPQQGLGFGNIYISANRAFTISQPWFAYTWRPAKDHLPDKTTAAMAYIVPSTWTVAANGLLQGIDDLGTRRRFRWATGYPTADYLYCLGAADTYNQFEATWTYSTLSMPLKFFIFQSSDTPSNRAAWLKTLDMLTVFSDRYGIYPFLQEKYGIYQFSNVYFSGMEHQTMTGQMGFSESTTAHELSHMWWADYVTCATWHDIWLNEGFGTYSEAIWEQYKPGSSGEPALHSAMASRRPSEPSGTVYCYDISNHSRVFDSNLSYRKGAWVVHMLRHVLGEEAFWDVLAAHRAAHQGGSVTTDQFQALAEAVTGRDLELFFWQWVYQPGAPRYYYAWRQSIADGRRYAEIMIRQYQGGTAPQVFTMPVDIALTDGSGSSTHVVWNDAREENLLIAMGTTDITTMQFDPKSWIHKAAAGTTTFAPGPPKIVTLSPALDSAVPVPGPAALDVGFHKDVIADPNAFALVGQRSGPASVTYAYDPQRFVVRLTPAAALPTDTYTWTVSDAIRDVEANFALDGELVKPGTTEPLPSGDGLPGGNAVATFYVTRAGDTNCDGAVTFSDINPFVLALSDPAGYAAAYPGCPVLNADAGGDGRVNFDDINPFVALLSR